MDAYLPAELPAELPTLAWRLPLVYLGFASASFMKNILFKPQKDPGFGQADVVRHFFHQLAVTVMVGLLALPTVVTLVVGSPKPPGWQLFGDVFHYFWFGFMVSVLFRRVRLHEANRTSLVHAAGAALALQQPPWARPLTTSTVLLLAVQLHALTDFVVDDAGRLTLPELWPEIDKDRAVVSSEPEDEEAAEKE